jgi:hypothetical protein
VAIRSLASLHLREALEPLLREVESLSERIQEYDRRIEIMAKEKYPETALLIESIRSWSHCIRRI